MREKISVIDLLYSEPCKKMLTGIAMLSAVIAFTKKGFCISDVIFFVAIVLLLLQNILPYCNKKKQGQVYIQRIGLTQENLNRVKEKHITICVETIGYKRTIIIEAKAVLRENGETKKTFYSHISQFASESSGDDRKVFLTAQTEQMLMEQLYNFLGDATAGQTAICADTKEMSYVENAFKRSGIDAEIYYLDREMVPYIYRQCK